MGGYQATMRRGDCLDCIQVEGIPPSVLVRRDAATGIHYEVALCDGEGVNATCDCIRPYVTENSCSNGLEKMEALHLGILYSIYFPFYLYLLAYNIYLIVVKCRPKRSTKLRRRVPCWKKISDSTVVLTVSLVGLVLRIVHSFGDPAQLFHIIPTPVLEQLLSFSNCCLMAAGILLLEIFVHLVYGALKMRKQDTRRKFRRAAIYSSIFVIALYSVVGILMRSFASRADQFTFFQFVILFDGCIGIFLLLIFVYWVARAIFLLREHGARLQEHGIDSGKIQRNRDLVRNLIRHLALLTISMTLLFIAILLWAAVGVAK